MERRPRPAAFFIADAPALDFLNSVCAPWGELFEWLEHGEDLLAWLQEAGLIGESVVDKLRSQVSPEALDKVAAQARELREWWRGIVSCYAGQALPEVPMAELEPLNRLLRSDRHYQQLYVLDSAADASHGPLGLQIQRQWQSADQLLLPLATVMAELLVQADFRQIKNCEGPSCPLWFYDVSKNHRRRWCSMAVCGNRAKAAAHRQRQKKA